MNKVVLTDKIITTPQTYLEMMAENYYLLREDNQLEEAEKNSISFIGAPFVWSNSNSGNPHRIRKT